MPALRWRAALVTAPLVAGLLAERPVASAAGEPVVEVRLFRFQPDTVRVRVGATVVWVNRDEIAHTVTGRASDAAFDRPLAMAGDSARVRFDRPGTVTYHCARHAFMRGVVTVTP